ncbi:Hypothetical protein R9X50_00535000 [Acrodontium crateriforme]|uniref:Uncharacterized protein n=1 Tax=Acrodontium crateriforme TaxID=150365 RepID=A0AAQ3M9F2_9PEZI|nr:Hypothetical protein R9X50_00535000 [Acrodontium crateriforme]
MFYDLNIPWPVASKTTGNSSGSSSPPSPTDINTLRHTIAFAHELGYSVIALNHTITGKLPAAGSPPNTIPEDLAVVLGTDAKARNGETRSTNDGELKNSSAINLDVAPADQKPHILRRLTIVLTESYQNARLAALAAAYDLLAVRPIDERTLQLACGSLDCDIISLDLTQRMGYYFKHKTVMEAIKQGKKFEICYAGATSTAGNTSGGSASEARRNLIQNATQLIRATRGRGIILSSEARAAVACRAPWDVINLAALWDLGTERGVEAVGKESRSAVVQAKMKRTGYRGVIDVIYGGTKEEPTQKATGETKNKKRKADTDSSSSAPVAEGNVKSETQVLSKTQLKKRARLEAVAKQKEAATER